MNEGLAFFRLPFNENTESDFLPSDYAIQELKNALNVNDLSKQKISIPSPLPEKFKDKNTYSLELRNFLIRNSGKVIFAFSDDTLPSYTIELK